MKNRKTAILHYTAPPVIGGVEGVIQAHARVFERLGYPLTVIAGRGDKTAFPDSIEYLELPEIDSRHDGVLKITNQLKQGHIGPDFDRWVERFVSTLEPVLDQFDNLIVHNIFSKQYNIPLTTALFRMLDEGSIPNTIAWVHDIAWASKNSRRDLHDGYPWDILKTFREDLTYVTISRLRQQEMAKLYGCDSDRIEIIYNGVDTEHILNLTSEGKALIDRLEVYDADLLILMPVRVTRQKNVEYAIKVLAELKKYFANPRAILSGPPDPHVDDSIHYFNQLQQMRIEFGVENEFRFVYETGPSQAVGYEIGLDIVGDLYRISDMLFMPSHSEGFGMPVLEAGLAGIPVFSTHIPASDEIGQDDVHFIDLSRSPAETALQITEVMRNAPASRFRRKVRQSYTWESIFLKKIKPLLTSKRGELER
jgi:mannosylglucosylglycerate synthase